MTVAELDADAAVAEAASCSTKRWRMPKLMSEVRSMTRDPEVSPAGSQRASMRPCPDCL